MRVKKTYGAIDIAKYVSALLVVAIHTYPFEEISPVFNTFFLSTVCRLAVPFFFTVSAFFFLRKYNGRSLEDTQPLMDYLRRVGQLYLVWTVIYLPYTIWNYASTGFSWYNIFSYLRDFLLNGSYYHLWFLPALMLGMVITFFFYRRFGMTRTLIFTAVLYLIGYAINIYAPIWQSMPYADFAYGFFEKTLVTPRDGIFFAPVFIALGFLLSKGMRLKLRPSAFGFTLSFIALILEVTIYYSLGLLHDLSSMFLMLVPCTYFLVSLLLSIRMPYRAQYGILRLDSTIIYTSHILFARIFLMFFPDAHMVVYLLTLAASQLLASLIVRYRERFPVLNLLV